jgi:hypothetical protein
MPARRLLPHCNINVWAQHTTSTGQFSLMPPYIIGFPWFAQHPTSAKLVMWSFLRKFLAATLCIVASTAIAHNEPGESPAVPPTGCDQLPAEALRTLPEPIAQWTALQCRGTGQVLVQSDGWVWRYPGSWTQHVFIPAWIMQSGARPDSLRYFSAMSVQSLDAERAAQIHRQLLRDVSAYEFHATRDGTSPSAGYTLQAQDESGNAFSIHFLYRSEADLWGVACVPECRSEFLFHISRRPQ